MTPEIQNSNTDNNTTKTVTRAFVTFAMTIVWEMNFNILFECKNATIMNCRERY